MLLVAIRDITEQKRAEESNRQRMAQFETLLNHVPLGVYVVDADFRISGSIRSHCPSLETSRWRVRP